MSRRARALGRVALTSALCATTGFALAISDGSGAPASLVLPTTASGLPGAGTGLTLLPREAASSSTSLPALPAFNEPWLSDNWSGYAVTGTGLDSVTGSWVVPAVQSTPSPAYSATWVGIDGFSSTDPWLIQVGTEQDAPGRYSAWWSTSYHEQPIGEPVYPGDAVWVDIHRVAGTTWVVSMGDSSQGWGFSLSVAYDGPGQSAEWVEEAPTVNGQTATLAQFSPVTFDLVTVNGSNPFLLPVDAGVMHPPGTTLPTAVPSLADLDTDGFSVAYGTVPPLPPSS
jgi:hypothetical protein